TPADKSPFAVPLGKFPDGMSDAEKERIRAAMIAAINKSIIPAYKKFEAFVRDEYAPKGQTNVGIWALPDGKARYAFRVKQQTTSDFTPEQIHQIGLN